MSHSWAHVHHTDRSHNAYGWELSKAHKTLYSFNNTFPDYGVKHDLLGSRKSQQNTTNGDRVAIHQWIQPQHRAKQVHSPTVITGHSTPETLIIAQRVIMSLIQGPDIPVLSKARGLSVGIQLPMKHPRLANPGVTGAL